MFDAMEAPRDVSSPLLIPRNTKFCSNPHEKLGLAWGVWNGNFCKIIEAPFLLKTQNQSAANTSLNKGDLMYQNIVGEMPSCGEAGWTIL